MSGIIVNGDLFNLMIDLNNLSSEDTEYILNLPYHLATAGMANEFHELLTEFEFIEYKNSAATP
ncbi:hypothetical protein QUB68_24695 [Microcoleus sp. A006_D1]|uniref:hypothetical protein n=1 Tax=Microcoleus sp. A006_D1 TaxID=3055267 RepID=UPI002FCFD8ED